MERKEEEVFGETPEEMFERGLLLLEEVHQIIRRIKFEALMSDKVGKNRSLNLLASILRNYFSRRK